MHGAIPLFPQYAFMAWHLFKHREDIRSKEIWWSGLILFRTGFLVNRVMTLWVP
jgi:hypothetical protein